MEIRVWIAHTHSLFCFCPTLPRDWRVEVGLPREWRGPDDTRDQLEAARRVLNHGLSQQEQATKLWNQPRMQWPAIIGMQPLEAAPATAAAGPSSSGQPADINWEAAEPAATQPAATYAEAPVCAAVCGEEREPTEQLVSCVHRMCLDCLDMLQRNECPLCRAGPAVRPHLFNPPRLPHFNPPMPGPPPPPEAPEVIEIAGSPPPSPGAPEAGSPQRSSSGDFDAIAGAVNRNTQRHLEALVREEEAGRRAAAAEQRVRDAENERDEAQEEADRLRNTIVDMTEEHRLEIESLAEEISGLRRDLAVANSTIDSMHETEDLWEGISVERSSEIQRLEREVQRLEALLRRGVPSLAQPVRPLQPNVLDSPAGPPLLLTSPPAAAPESTPTGEEAGAIAAMQVVADLVDDLHLGESLCLIAWFHNGHMRVSV